MRYWFVILALAYSLYTWGDQLSAEVSTYNSATMVNIPCEEAWVSFSNTSHSKGDIRKGDTATWQVGGIPPCQVTAITLTISSNTSSGAGEIQLHLHGTESILAQGIYRLWQGIGDWSTIGVPFTFTSQWSMAEYDTLQVCIIGTENSLHVSRLDITYTTNPPVPHTVTLMWQTNDGVTHTQSVTERAVGTGVDLPRRDSAIINKDLWTFVGWTTDVTPTSNTHYERPGTIFYPQHDLTFYALYENKGEQIDIQQDTAHISGEYVIAAKWIDDWRMLYDGTNRESIRTHFTSISQHKGIYTLNQAYVDSAARYQVTFQEDSLYIRHIQSQLGIGARNKKLTSQLSAWAWEEKDYHSLCIYLPITTKSGANYMLWMKESAEQEIVATIGAFQRSSMEQGWLLFPVANVPYLPSETLWSTHPYELTDIPPVNEIKYPSCKKYFIHNQLRLQQGNRIYSPQGQLIRQSRQ